ncbi:MAG: DUF4191 domain-containing protein [Actinobacteria bacterium]|nr:DUF4191 domain-containing protein [Actinomycetota bacterium]
MAKTAAPGRVKLTREQKKQARLERRQQRRETWRNMLEAFRMTAAEDRSFLPLFVAAIVLGAAVGFAVPYLIDGSLLYSIPIAVILAAVGGMIVFSRSANRMTFAKADGTPGAAAWVLSNRLKSNQIRGDWRVSEAVAATAQLDAVHRVIGFPGIVLVGEGNGPRVRSLLAQEKKKVSRVAGDVPIYDIVVGNDEGEVPLRKLATHLQKLPKNLAKAEIGNVERRLAALGNRRAPLPQGPMPAGAKMRNVQRAVRRRS